MRLPSLHDVWHESGLRAVYATGADAWLVILARCTRMFAYGAGSLVLALFFNELHVPDSRIGLFMTLTLLGDVALSLLLTLVADHLGRRRVLLGGSLLMMVSGAVFAVFENYWVLLGAAVVGVISASGGDFGPFRAVEESVISELTTPETRADVYVWYVTTSTLGSSLGTESAGRFVETLRARPGGSLLHAYHTCFWLYVVMGAVNVLCSLLLSARCELKQRVAQASESRRPESTAFLNSQDGTAAAADDDDDDDDDEQQTRAAEASTSEAEEEEKTKKSRFSQISRETRSVMYVLWFLLMVDSVADGMVSMSLTTYYMDRKFHVAKSVLGDFLSASYLLAALSTIFAGPLSRRIGYVRTMVLTHAPSSAAVLLFPAPPSLALTFVLLLVRVGLNNMDQAPRSALIAAVVRPEERTAVMGITGMLRTLAATTGPSVTGLLAGRDRFWVAFVAAGALRLAYDLGVFVMFVNIQLYKHEQNDSVPLQETAARRESDGGEET